jgi:hypothetical protein
LSGIAAGNPTLSFTLTAGHNAAPIKSIAIKPPRGITFTDTTKHLANGIRIKTLAGKQLKFTARLRRGMLTITLAGAATGVQVKVARPAIAVMKSRATKTRHKHAHRLNFVVKVTNSARATTKLMPSSVTAGRRPIRDR